MKKLVYILFMFLTLAFCYISESVACKNVKQLCDKITEIKEIPSLDFENEVFVSDDIYNGLVRMQEAAVPCLIEKITDTTMMPDPRQEPTWGDAMVGEVAFFILRYMMQIPLEEVFPAQLYQEWEEERVDAFLRFMRAGEENRKLLQANLKVWYKNYVAKTLNTEETLPQQAKE